MNIAERLQLIKAGYSKKEIEALIASEKEDDPTPEETDNVKPEGAAQDEQQKEAEAEDVSESVDYKAMFEALQAKVEEDAKTFEEKLRQAQLDNINKDTGRDIESPEEVLSKFFNY